MKKVLSLTNEQLHALYIIMANAKNLDRAKNRARWKFLEVIEDRVFEYEKMLRSAEVKLASAPDEDKVRVLEEVQDGKASLAGERFDYTWNDREVFAEAKAIFEQAYEGQTQRIGKMYKEIEDAFLDVREVES